jgi:DNA-binding response OmpR family regulator
MHNIKLVQTMLKSQGYEIITALDGMEALRRATKDSPDLVLLDVIMPNMDGFEVAQELRSRPETKAIPILMLTALSGVDDKVKALEVGADDFLSKPVRYVELIARVRSHLRLKQLHDELQLKNALLERVLARYVPEEVARDIMRDPEQSLRSEGESKETAAK